MRPKFKLVDFTFRTICSNTNIRDPKVLCFTVCCLIRLDVSRQKRLWTFIWNPSSNLKPKCLLSAANTDNTHTRTYTLAHTLTWPHPRCSVLPHKPIHIVAAPPLFLCSRSFHCHKLCPFSAATDQVIKPHYKYLSLTLIHFHVLFRFKLFFGLSFVFMVCFWSGQCFLFWSLLPRLCIYRHCVTMPMFPTSFSS